MLLFISLKFRSSPTSTLVNNVIISWQTPPNESLCAVHLPYVSLEEISPLGLDGQSPAWPMFCLVAVWEGRNGEEVEATAAKQGDALRAGLRGKLWE